ncbi:nucleotide sugar dehydrogenase [Calditrichota bacterium]
MTDNPNNSPHFELLIEKINTHKAVVGIIGLGYVGLPLAVGFARCGFRVIGFELDDRKISKINQGENYIGDVNSEELAKLVRDGQLSATSEYSVLRDVDVVVICVPTPLRKTGDPDIGSIVSARDEVAKYLHSGQAIVLESTTYPGTIDELVKPTLMESGLEIGSDFFLAFSPERIDPNNDTYTVEVTPKVVGGVTPQCTEVVVAFYSQMIKTVVPVSSPTTAEMVKLLENTFRAINIGLANEVAIMCRVLGLDVWEVINAAATKPFGFMPFYPGPGLGGHCIPVDPAYLSWKLRTLQYRTRFIELATEINTAMPEYVTRLVSSALNDDAKSIRRSKILLLGMAYKKDIDDVRESPALDVMRLLHNLGAEVTYHDKFVPSVSEGGDTVHSVDMTQDILKSADIVIILTDHSHVDYNEVCQHAKLVLDTRNATKNVRDSHARVVKL